MLEKKGEYSGGVQGIMWQCLAPEEKKTNDQEYR